MIGVAHICGLPYIPTEQQGSVGVGAGGLQLRTGRSESIHEGRRFKLRPEK